MKEAVSLPDVVIVSPYIRTRNTFMVMASAWPELERKSSVYYDDRVREQEHGLSLLYNDWRVFETMHPEQRRLRKLLGTYWYQYPQGESAAQTRERVRSMMNTIIREWAGRHVLLITHHLTILSVRANLERLSSEEFIRLDEEEKPRNCGVTIYRGNPHRGANGKLELECYNRCFWDDPNTHTE
jgi:broad specificity phosphatase PhoE